MLNTCVSVRSEAKAVNLVFLPRRSSEPVHLVALLLLLYLGFLYLQYDMKDNDPNLLLFCQLVICNWQRFVNSTCVL